MLIYIDKEYRCHARPGEGLSAWDVPFFDGKCRRFVEGYRYVPPGEVWQRKDGAKFKGEMIAPLENCKIPHAAQQVFESLRPQLEKLEEIREDLFGLSSNPGLDHLLDFINTIRELLED